MVPFDVLSMGNISNFHLEPSNLHFFQFFKFQSPLLSPKKILWIIRFMVLKTTGLNQGFQCNNRFEKYAPGPEILAKTSKFKHVWFGDLDFGPFWLISWDLVHIFQIWLLRKNSELKPVVLNTMNLIIQMIFFSLIKGPEKFCFCKLAKGSLQKKKPEIYWSFTNTGGGEYPPTNIFPVFS